MNSRRRRQQEATNAYKAALSKELNKRNKTPVSRISSASSVGKSNALKIDAKDLDTFLLLGTQARPPRIPGENLRCTDMMQFILAVSY